MKMKGNTGKVDRNTSTKTPAPCRSRSVTRGVESLTPAVEDPAPHALESGSPSTREALPILR
jgi:hypothetical protein